jgi:hypothetical protein
MPPQEALFGGQSGGRVRPPRPPRHAGGDAPSFQAPNGYGAPRSPFPSSGMGFPGASPVARPPPQASFGATPSSAGFGTPTTYNQNLATGTAPQDPRLFQSAGASPNAKAFPSSNPNAGMQTPSYGVPVDPRFPSRPIMPLPTSSQSLDPRFASATPVSNQQDIKPVHNGATPVPSSIQTSDPRFQNADLRIQPTDLRLQSMNPGSADPRFATFHRSTTPPFPPPPSLPLLPGPPRPPQNMEVAATVKQEPEVALTSDSGKLRPMFCVVCASNNVS